MSRRLLSSLALVTALSAVTLTTAGPAQAKPDTSHQGVVGVVAQLSPEVARTAHGTGVDARAAALAAYWTPDRMRAALPESEIPAVKNARPGQVTGAASRPQGTAGRVAPAPPVAKPRADLPEMGTNAYDPAYPVGHPTARTTGKVFFTLSGLNYVCSAAVVNTEGKSSVWSAGHCMTGNLQWATNWAFVPNYVNGSAPYGYWYATGLWTTSAWYNNNGDFANDVGSAVIGRVNGWRITDYLGGQGIAWNQAVGQYDYAFGYPQASPFNGQTLWAENGPTYDGGGGTIYMTNYMTGGSSGGPWLMAFDGNWGLINGHNDFKYNNLPQYMYSPYYGNQVAGLYNTVRNISS
ncbi:peptidase [Micromonospora sp. NBC_01392]|uniref:trypsin-like serine peptidase n=1 Tax=Micromonospora sp. NBC_01392 TaxID=2903588 RepID=UPI0032544E94